MKKIERKITLNGVDNYVKIFLTNTMNNMGLFVDTDYIPKTNNIVDYTILTEKLNQYGLLFPFMTGGTMSNFGEKNDAFTRDVNKNVEYFYSYDLVSVTGETDSKVIIFKDYNNDYILHENVNIDEISNYNNDVVNIGSKITMTSETEFNYVIDYNINDDPLTTTSGLKYSDLIDENKTSFKFKNEGFNETNIDLKNIIKEDYLLGVISKPEINNDVFIDRTTFSVLDLHLRFNEIKSLDDLTTYGNGFYKIIKN